MYIAGLALPKAKRQSGRFKATEWTFHPTFFTRFMLDFVI